LKIQIPRLHLWGFWLRILGLRGDLGIQLPQVKFLPVLPDLRITVVQVFLTLLGAYTSLGALERYRSWSAGLQTLYF
jgi:hypothetical protein